MPNTLNETLEPQEEKEEKWKITSDEQADWWIEVKEEELAEVRRLKMQLENKISLYKEKLEKAQKEEEFIINLRNAKLLEYFETIDKKDMKKTQTMWKYRLPSGELIKKFHNPEFKRDDVKLTEWLEDNQMNEYIKVKKQANWDELKKKTKVIDGQVIVEDTGEIVDGIEVIEKAPEFKVKV